MTCTFKDDGLAYGKGKIEYPDGSVYTGDILAGISEGEGTFKGSMAYCLKVFGTKRWDIKSTYSGSWIRNRPNGYGEYSRTEVGSDKRHHLYCGWWKGGYPHGPGFMLYNEFDFIDGVFEEGVMYGFSHEINVDNTCIV